MKQLIINSIAQLKSPPFNKESRENLIWLIKSHPYLHRIEFDIKIETYKFWLEGYSFDLDFKFNNIPLHNWDIDRLARPMPKIKNFKNSPKLKESLKGNEETLKKFFSIFFELVLSNFQKTDSEFITLILTEELFLNIREGKRASI